jgi:hypothetical protein
MKKFLLVTSFIFFIFIIGCDKENNPVNETPTNTDIPADPANVVVPPTTVNNIQPTSNFTKSSSVPNRVLMNVTGIINPVTNQPIQLSLQP